MLLEFVMNLQSVFAHISALPQEHRDDVQQNSRALGSSRASAAGAINGAQQASLTGIDNDTRRVDRARLGALSGIDAGTSGVYYFDAFESRPLTYIGP